VEIIREETAKDKMNVGGRTALSSQSVRKVIALIVEFDAFCRRTLGRVKHEDSVGCHVLDNCGRRTLIEMKRDEFYSKALEQSRVKVSIVTEYFSVWAKVILGATDRHGHNQQTKIAYIDLFAGQGLYDDGMPSTPIRVLQTAVKDQKIRSHLVSIFNDKDKRSSKRLEQEIAKVEGIDLLKYSPKVLSGEVGEELVHILKKMKLAPTLLFLDPWGYKGVSLGLLWSVLKDWGCDCIFFFNYNRVQSALYNPKVTQWVNAMFGDQRAEVLRGRLESLSAKDREREIMKELEKALREIGGQYVSKLRFLKAKGRGTSHYLVFVSKNFKGLEIMRPILAKASPISDEGVPSFVYDPSERRKEISFLPQKTLEDLARMLLRDFSGHKITVDMIYHTHVPNSGAEYLRANYRDSVQLLYNTGQISLDTTNADSKKRKSCRITSKTVVLFPEHTE
jgi:three-Cys-motif partner protein